MGKVGTFMSMSLDGFIAGPNDEIDPLHDWLFTNAPEGGGKGNWEKTGGKPERFFGPEGVNKEILDEGLARGGATITGRRTYEISKAWGGKPPGSGPFFVLTHNPPPPSELTRVFTYVDDFDEALKQARAATPSGTVGLMGASLTQQALNAGVLDEIVIALIPVLLGQGIPLFDHLGTGHVMLERKRVVPGPQGVTHLFYGVRR